MARILAVEDEPGIALALEGSLRLEGYEVEVVADGIIACRRALGTGLDLILRRPDGECNRRQRHRGALPPAGFQYQDPISIAGTVGARS
jgi:hypothetical protein